MEAPFSSNKPYMLRAVYEWILDNGATPYLLVDATQTSVCVPEQHIQDGQIVLNVEPSAIQNWFADNNAISFNARFGGKAMNIYIPITALLAIYAQENGLGMAFPPEEEIEGIINRIDNTDSKRQTSKEVDETVSASRVQEEGSNNQKPSEIVSIKAKKKSHLKVVK